MKNLCTLWVPLPLGLDGKPTPFCFHFSATNLMKNVPRLVTFFPPMFKPTNIWFEKNQSKDPTVFFQSFFHLLPSLRCSSIPRVFLFFCHLWMFFCPLLNNPPFKPKESEFGCAILGTNQLEKYIEKSSLKEEREGCFTRVFTIRC